MFQVIVGYVRCGWRNRRLPRAVSLADGRQQVEVRFSHHFRSGAQRGLVRGILRRVRETRRYSLDDRSLIVARDPPVRGRAPGSEVQCAVASLCSYAPTGPCAWDRRSVRWPAPEDRSPFDDVPGIPLSFRMHLGSSAEQSLQRRPRDSQTVARECKYATDNLCNDHRRPWL